MARILDERGRPIERTAATPIAGLLDASQNQFEGLVQIKVYNDAIEAKGRCAHCDGPVEAVLYLPAGYLNAQDSQERIADARQQIIKKFKKQHYCIARLDAGKRVKADWLRQFDNTCQVYSGNRP